MIEKYVLSMEHFMSPYGIRSLSKTSEYYNNARWGNPPRFDDHRRITNSNWQGPVWTLLSYLMFHALLHYGYRQEAENLTASTLSVLADSVRKIGSFSENFHGDTGEPLFASGYASFNTIADMMSVEMEENKWIMDPVFENPKISGLQK